jgi:glycosyltransferase involved in cell wall biosynthesis
MMLLKLLQNLDRSRFEPSVISLRTKGEVGPRIEALGVHVLALCMNPGLPNPLKLLALVNYVRKIRPHLVQTWMYHADLLGGVAARLAGCKRVVWALRNSNLSKEMTKRSTLMVVRACAFLSSWLPRKILSCSTRAGAVHVGVGYRQDKISIIPNGFDLARFRPDATSRGSVREELGLPGDARLIGLMARYDPQKNHAGFIEAAAMIHKTLPDVHFVLAGSGIDKKNTSLRGSIGAHGLEACIHLLGRRDDMPRLMASLDVLASSSFGEAFPNVLGEAMASGVPCVVTDVGDSAEIVGETGKVVQPGDMQGLAQHIVEMLRLPQEEKRELGIKARARVEACYDIGHVTRLYEMFYERIAQGSE